ncbi:helix-turn-helix transcriptional regulator [Arsenophonus sp. ENCA]|uniref:helix-turn-helix transcriptional regulator n=1 Tax=Arsenophonus sp. ENCA TaxID=1987579 RepID=UPI000BD7DE10|nr:helix-turn-helix transcriptional regulator [Arsenophonus sp. ENCA]PAV07710.1 helix-turn-helix transcriptional regulator [Arsenophonus sp. ENCA]
MHPFRIKNFKTYSELFPKLSKREIQILSMSRSGLTNSEIALCLNISVRTVDNHFNSAMQKHELKTYSALRAFFNFAIEDYLIETKQK